VLASEIAQFDKSHCSHTRHLHSNYGLGVLLKSGLGVIQTSPSPFISFKKQ